MPVIKSFRVFGDPAEINADGCNATTFSVGSQTCHPGGGPPPHMHLYEDEFFLPLSGEFEIFNGETWEPLTSAGHYAERGRIHTFRNSGNSEGKICFICSPSRFPEYLERISSFTLPQDMQQLVDLSARYGISFHFPGVPQASELAPVSDLALA